MSGLPQAGQLANKLLAKQLNLVGYYQCQCTAGLWRHVWCPITSAWWWTILALKLPALPMPSTSNKLSNIDVDWKGQLYGGIHLDWDYKHRTIHLSMPDYISKELTRFQHSPPLKPHHTPYQAAPIQYGQTVQLVRAQDTSPKLSPEQIKHIKQVIDTLLYYSQAVDPTLAAALSTIPSQQANSTQAILDACKQLLDYAATHPNAFIQCCTSNMIPALDTDGSYLSEPEGKSRAATYFYLTKQNAPDFHNGAVLVLSAIIKHIMASASEMELAALFYSCKEKIPLCTTLEEMGHPQPGPTPVTTDNTTAIGLTLNTMTPKASKSMDMQLQWLKCRQAQSLFHYLWAKGVKNRADYPSKHHSISHHQSVRSSYVARTTCSHSNPLLLTISRDFYTLFGSVARALPLARVC
eukprot:CCRYP_006559-RA/>CCRYP_006559-RA protein AED:0.38 eAED:0.33 QI:0/0/0/1/0/0/2/0/408